MDLGQPTISGAGRSAAWPWLGFHQCFWGNGHGELWCRLSIGASGEAEGMSVADGGNMGWRLGGCEVGCLGMDQSPSI